MKLFWDHANRMKNVGKNLSEYEEHAQLTTCYIKSELLNITLGE